MDSFVLWGAYEWLSFAIAAATNVGSIIACVILTWWYFVKLRHSRTSLRPFIGSVAIAKGNLWLWSLGNMIDMAVGGSPPLLTLPARIGWLVVVYLQVRTATRIRPTESAEMVAELVASRQDSRILILEDDSDVAELYKLALSDFGYDCVVAGTGGYALAVMRWRMPKLLVVDINLPDMDGYQFIAAARSMGYAGPAVAVSGAPVDEGRGFTTMLLKPFRPEDMVAVVRANLASSG